MGHREVRRLLLAIDDLGHAERLRTAGNEKYDLIGSVDHRTGKCDSPLTAFGVDSNGADSLVAQQVHTIRKDRSRMPVGTHTEHIDVEDGKAIRILGKHFR